MDIRIRGVSVHNLRAVDLDLPRERLMVFTGSSARPGSRPTSSSPA